MFLETVNTGRKRGCIEVISGSMFSGKTEELIRRLRRAELARQVIEIYKPEMDKRYHPLKLVSHRGTEIVSTPVRDSAHILSLTAYPDVAGIDEAQFFDEGLPSVCNKLADAGVRVIAAGLDLDYKGQPFGPLAPLLAMAEYVTKVHAICLRCGNLAYISHRKGPSADLVLVGEADDYEPLCRDCFNHRQADVQAQ